MTSKQYRETSYHLWNPDTNMNMFLDYFGVGPTVITQKGSYVCNDHGVSYLSSTSTIWNVVMGLSQEELVEVAGKQRRNLTFSSFILRLLPPLIINENIAHRIVSILDKALHTGIAAEIDRKVLLAKEFALAKLRFRY